MMTSFIHIPRSGMPGCCLGPRSFRLLAGCIFSSRRCRAGRRGPCRSSALHHGIGTRPTGKKGMDKGFGRSHTLSLFLSPSTLPRPLRLAPVPSTPPKGSGVQGCEHATPAVGTPATCCTAAVGPSRDAAFSLPPLACLALAAEADWQRPRRRRLRHCSRRHGARLPGGLSRAGGGAAQRL